MLVSFTRIKLQDRYILRARGVILIDVIFGDLGCRRLEAKNRDFGFSELRTVIGPRSCLSHRELLCHMYFLKIRPGCEEIFSRVNGWKMRFLEVCSETKIFIINISLLTSAGHD